MDNNRPQSLNWFVIQCLTGILFFFIYGYWLFQIVLYKLLSDAQQHEI